MNIAPTKRTVIDFDVLESTNLTAQTYPLWTVIRASRQTGGRGRFKRRWESSKGGLWVSVVVPIHTQSVLHLPLVSGLAVIQALEKFNVQNLRLRWPNDVMVGRKKLAGILVERHKADQAIVGIGVNVSNNPETTSNYLNGTATQLKDLISFVPDMNILMELIIDRLEKVITLFNSNGLSSFLNILEPYWNLPCQLEIHMDQGSLQGEFEGIDAMGQILLRDKHNTLHHLDGAKITQVKDLVRSEQ